MLIGAIADDFTGASDIANTLAKGIRSEGGLRTVQYPGIPTASASPEVSAGVISLKSRTAPAEIAVRDSLAALDWLLAQGCRQIIFKYCSTFDSTPDGNIGPVAYSLSKALDVSGVMVCPAFPGAGRTIYNGHLFVGDVLLSDSGMQNHPLTPMSDPDIRRWLRQQSNGTVGHLPLITILSGPKAVREAISWSEDDFIVADAVSDDNLLTIGAALDGAAFVTGGSGIALGLPRNFFRNGHAEPQEPKTAHSSCPEAILAGSCSATTRGQVELHSKSHPTFPIDVSGAMEGRISSGDLVNFVETNIGRAPLAYSSGTPEEIHRIQLAFGRDAVARTLDSLFAETARSLVQRGFRRLVVAGGETSGAVTQAVSDEMGAQSMEVAKEIDPGVPVLTLGDDQPILLALKSGNFGAPDFFAKALRIMEGKA